MRRILLLLLILSMLCVPVSAAEITAPPVPPSGEDLMPAEHASFGEGVMMILRDALSVLRPDLKEAASVCLEAVAVALLTSVILTFPGMSGKVTELVGSVAVAVLLLKGTNSLVNLGAKTVDELTEYGKLLLPVMACSLAAQGGVTASAALYAGTAAFNALLSSILSSVLLPLVYVYLAIAAANSATGESTLKKIRDFVKWLMTWTLKTILYIFTAYMGITGVVSGTTDAAMLKAAKLTISGMVPVVGGILSDASESVLVSAGVMKNAAGIYGILAVLAVTAVPFLRIGVHYLLIKATGAVCSVFASKGISELIRDFAGAMGLLLAMTGSVCLLLLISTVCFLKGVG